jgi:hypothetical protein
MLVGVNSTRGDSLTRRFDIGPVILALGALALLVSLFLDWFATWNAWEVFEITDVILAGLAIAALVAAAGLLIPDVDYVDRRVLPWIVGAAAVLVINVLLSPGAVLEDADYETGIWVALAAVVVMILGALLSLSRVSFSVAMEGRDRRQRVSAVDHRPPPTETGAPVSRSSTSLLRPRDREEPEAGEKG